MQVFLLTFTYACDILKLQIKVGACLADLRKAL